jgi:hypothetical protein
MSLPYSILSICIVHIHILYSKVLKSHASYLFLRDYIVLFSVTWLYINLYIYLTILLLFNAI